MSGFGGYGGKPLFINPVVIEDENGITATVTPTEEGEKFMRRLKSTMPAPLRSLDDWSEGYNAGLEAAMDVVYPLHSLSNGFLRRMHEDIGALKIVDPGSDRPSQSAAEVAP